MIVGLTYDLKHDVRIVPGEPDDALEEYDSHETIDAIASALNALGHSVVRLGGGRAFLENILKTNVDMVFNIAEGRGTGRSREVQVPAVLEMLDIPYAGSDPECLAICLDKPLSKQLVADAGVATPAWKVISGADELATADWAGFTFPAFAKPAYEGSSKGIGVSALAETAAALQREVRRLLEVYHQPVLVEEFVRGDEITVGVAGDPLEVLGVMRVMPSGGTNPDFFYSIDVKRDWERLVRYECPARLPGDAVRNIMRDSLTVVQVLGCRDMARVDFRLDACGRPQFIEANPLPGLKPGHSDYPMLAQKMGIDHTGLIRLILESAASRYHQCQKLSA
jgi:D-alanine-D-alanine ligase